MAKSGEVTFYERKPQNKRRSKMGSFRVLDMTNITELLQELLESPRVVMIKIEKDDDQ